LAFGTLVYEGTPVRLSGQDSARGTFSQRHAVLTDFESGTEYVPLQNISPDQASFEVYDSLLSEAAVLGFEFGYSAADPLSLVLWEAQFGDFANGAQVIIDNFISSSDAKWRQPCDLVLLLPHGFEGQGPEHSSARLERFLSLCAEDNMKVCFPTTPAQYFHLLRHQMRDAKQVPLVVLTPKSILRNPKSVSRSRELAEGRFEMVLDDPAVREKAGVRRVLLCSGKVYYDLLAERERKPLSGIAIVRLEQLYPFPEWSLSKILSACENAEEIFWVQEEPRNMGAWNYIRGNMEHSIALGRSLRYIGRPESASPAAGSHKAHIKEQAKILRDAFE
jgi:2-oxoglutarate dehydrogenase E1 component